MVVEEQRGGGEARTWSVTETKPAGGDREHADEVARRLAFGHRPVHPASVEERKVLRVGEGYLVIATGRTGSGHFRVTLGETVAEPA
ncbi:hypothetical protein [Amycolatopsis australiensis]|uniref:hypothetical protein n=1 Tax=Amycolatopsis australiensis TaxID=546364 RepID=UPI001FE7F5E3|nr:hypothetical protein [Amycolatopsis australiensis]